MLNRINRAYRIYSAGPAATEEQLAGLRSHFKTIPMDYLELVSEITELELGLDSGLYLRIWSPEGCIDMDVGYHIQSIVPGSFPLGDNGGCKYIYYHNSDYRYGLYCLGYGEPDNSDAVWISESLTALLSNCDGIEKIAETGGAI